MRTFVRRWLLGLLPIVAACGLTDVEMGDRRFDDDLFVEELTADELEALVQEAEAQFEVEFLPGGLTASTLGVRTEATDEDDRIQSRIAAMDETGEGSLTLQLADIRIAFGAQTRFWVGEDEVSRADFVERVRDDLDQGFFSPIVAERLAPSHAQGPSDDAFVARDVVLGGDGEPALRMKLGRDNLEFAAAPAPNEPDGWLKLLGCRVRLRMRDGTTHVERHRHTFQRLEGFHGQVTAIDLANHRLALEDGTVVNVVRQTRFVRWSGYAGSLEAAVAALERGNELEARGIGTRERRGAKELLGLKIALKIEEPEAPVLMEFEGVVDALNEVQNGNPSLVLGDGTVVRLRANTELVAADGDSPSTLAGLREVLRAGRAVSVSGRGELENQQPLVLGGVRVVIRAEPEPVEPEPDLVQFAGRVDFVDAFNGMIFLTDGAMINVGAETTVTSANDASPASLEAAAEAVDSGRRVLLSGAGTAGGSNQFDAVRLEFELQVESFEMDVSVVDPAGGLILENGSFVLVTEATVFVAANGDSPSSFMGIYDALDAGDRVRVTGTGYVTGGNPDDGEPYSFEAIQMTVLRIPQG